MLPNNLNELAAFTVIATECSFTKAAAKLGVSQPTLSHTIRALESRLGLRLLNRTTRSVSPTEAGKRLLHAVAPRLEEIEQELAALSALRDAPAGLVRITSTEHAAVSLLQPALAQILPQYPDIRVEISVNNGLTDIVAEGFDAGVRLGEQVAKDMVALRLGPPVTLAVVGAPSYFAQNPPPRLPQDLTAHNCINSRLPTHDSLMAWEFSKDGQEVKVRAEGQLVLNNIQMRVQSALDGLGLIYLPRSHVAAHIAAGRLVQVLEDWCPPLSAYHLYYPSRHHHSAAFTRVLDVLRANAPS